VYHTLHVEPQPGRSLPCDGCSGSGESSVYPGRACAACSGGGLYEPARRGPGACRLCDGPEGRGPGPCARCTRLLAQIAGVLR
jgi:hypothetical protein